jgi:signal transduction histidine kinase
MRRDFIANASHELKTPLGALALLAETLGTTEDPEVTRRFSGRIIDEAARLSTLLEDLLDLSRAETSRSRFAATGLAAVVDDVSAELRERAGEYGVELVVDDVPTDAVVTGDHRQLRSLVTNLVDNAVKYSESGNGSPPRVWLRVAVAGDEVVIEVEDEGIGIPEAHLGRVFERFYRVDRARSRATGGTGLGLSIVRNVAAGHGGRVTVESQVGQGSVFRVLLPLRREP